MKFRLGLSVLFLAAFLNAQTEMNLEQLADFVRSELALKQHTDKQLALSIKKLKLTEKLTDKTIIDLEAQGAGPKTLQALHDLQVQNASLKPPAQEATSSPASAPETPIQTQPSIKLGAKTTPIPPPDAVRQQHMLDEIKQYALSYTQNLPNFVCVEVVRRFVDPKTLDHYRSLGNILAKVSYNQGQENYQVYSVNGRYTTASFDEVATSGGAVSSGEFGSLMSEIFEARSQAEFGWEKWATLRGRRMAVFNYFINSGHSNYSISYSAGPGDQQRIVTAYKGLIYADENTGEVARIKFIAVDIPQSFPVREATEILDYDLVDINGQQYICPLAAKLFMTANHDRTKNELEFRDYRKFGTNSVITYDTNPLAPAPEPLPASKTEEQPASEGSSTPQKTRQTTAGQTTKPASSTPWSLPSAPPPPPQ